MAAEPVGELTIRTLAMPADTNPGGHIFGGWVVSQMDLAGLSIASSYSSHRCVTVAIEAMRFLAPVHVGDFICCYGQLVKVGRTSMHIHIETWAVGTQDKSRRKVTEGTFVFVALDAAGKPIPVQEK